jgi:hypothetical protein
MTCDEAMTMLAAAVGAASRETGEAALPAEVTSHVASCPHCLEELAALGAIVSGEASMLLDNAYRTNGCDLVGRLLPGWMASNVAMAALREQHAAAWRHIETCERCQTECSELQELIMAARAGEFGPIPGDRAPEKPGDEIASVLGRRFAERPGDLAIDLVNPAYSWPSAVDTARSPGGREDAAENLILGVLARPGSTQNRQDFKTAGSNDARPMVLGCLQAGWSFLNPRDAAQVLREAVVNVRVPGTGRGTGRGD